jgi:hypothetical protein
MLPGYAKVSNGLASNVNFDQEDRDAYGLVFGGGVGYAGDDFELGYEVAGHSYTNTSRWDRVSHRLEAEFEHDLPGNWELETVGQISFKGSSEDRDLVDQDFEISPRLEYRFTDERRLRLFTTHRLKRYDDAPRPTRSSITSVPSSGKRSGPGVTGRLEVASRPMASASTGATIAAGRTGWSMGFQSRNATRS